MDKFRAAGMKAGLAAPDRELIAGVNHVNNFILWIAGVIHNGIVDALDPDNPQEIDWFNEYAREDRPYKIPLVREIATEIYNISTGRNP